MVTSGRGDPMATEILRLPRLFVGSPPPLRLWSERVVLRPAERTDFDGWAGVRAESRRLLAPSGPSWHSDARTRGAFPRPLSRCASGWPGGPGHRPFAFLPEEAALMR